MKRSLAALLFALLPLPALAATGDWVQAEHVRVRLLADPALPDGTLQAALQIVLDPGWKTYWRSPGDAGVPPKLDFSASRNATLQATEFPPPQRFDDGYAVSNIYHDAVTLPLTLKARPGEGSRLVLDAFLGVCRDVCMPIQLNASLDIAPSGADAEATNAIAAGRAALPQAPQPGRFDIASVERIGGSDAKPQFEVRAIAPDLDDAVLFVETPADWYPDPPRVVHPGIYRFSVDRRGSTTAIGGAPLQFTLVSGKAAMEKAVTISDAGK